MLRAKCSRGACRCRLLKLTRRGTTTALCGDFGILPLGGQVAVVGGGEAGRVKEAGCLVFLPLTTLLVVVDGVRTITQAAGSFTGSIVRTIRRGAKRANRALRSVTARASRPAVPATAPLPGGGIRCGKMMISSAKGKLTSTALKTRVLGSKAFRGVGVPSAGASTGNGFSFATVRNVAAVAVSGGSVSTSVGVGDRSHLGLGVILLDTTTEGGVRRGLRMFSIIRGVPIFPKKRATLVRCVDRGLHCPTGTRRREVRKQIVTNFIMRGSKSVDAPAVMQSIDPRISTRTVQMLSAVPG